MSLEFRLIWSCLCLACVVLYISVDCKEVYATTERPKVIYVNPKYFEYFNMTAHRYHRRNPLYMMDVHMRTLRNLDEKMVAHFYYYQFISNSYKKTFVEVHLKVCDVERDSFIVGDGMRRALQNMIDRMPPEERFMNSTHCPYPPGKYELLNMTVPRSPMYKSFPFQKGRIYVNVTVGNELAVAMHVDLEIKNFY